MNKIFNECALKTMSRMPDESIDLTVTSPPYDNLRKYNGFIFDFESIAKELFRVTIRGGVLVWVVSDQSIKGSESGTSFRQALRFKEIGFNIHDTMIFQKQNYVPLTHNRYEQSFEYMFVFSKGKPTTFNPKKIPCKHPNKIEKVGLSRRKSFGKLHALRIREDGFLKIGIEKIHPNIFTYSLGGSRTGHPAAFPDKLAEDHILTWSNEGDLVYDPFMGSGTTALMTKKNKRNYIGSEISAEYCAIINKRLL